MIPKLWPNSTIVCIGNGPSSRVLKPDDPVVGAMVARAHPDIAFCHGRARVLAISRSYALIPWADAALVRQSEPFRWMLPKLWPEITIVFLGNVGKKREFAKHVQAPDGKHLCGVRVDLSAPGLSNDPSVLNFRGAKGYAAINAAVHLGAKRIVLLGYDHTDAATWYPGYETLVEPLRELGIEVLNASRQTELTVFPRVTLAEALAN